MAIARGDYGEGIRRIAGGRFEPGVLEVRPDTPDALIALGLPNLPMHHTTAHAAAEMAPEGANGHGVDPAVLLSLPELLEHPVAAVESGSRDGVLAVVLDAVAGDRDDPLTAMIDPGAPLGCGGQDLMETNFILSVHGRRHIMREVSDALAKGEALLYDGPRFWSLIARCKRTWEECDSQRSEQNADRRAPHAGQDGHRWAKMGSVGRRPGH